jgi:hypothetical protein
MKTLKSYFAFGLALLIAAASLAYSLKTAARVRDLEQRLRRAEVVWQSQNQLSSAERIRALEARVQQDESLSSQPRFIEINRTSGLDQQMNQHPEPPRLTPRHWEPSDLERLASSTPSDPAAAR